MYRMLSSHVHQSPRLTSYPLPRYSRPIRCAVTRCLKYALITRGSSSVPVMIWSRFKLDLSTKNTFSIGFMSGE
ncbi:hypothetical protein Pst134EA_033144 [Puccinia striiformis f. sp. tritici]|uniref:hypothetical protein n=1 Tax=Puccinia striiformis f. sp. tritici TaxID=168172 RepID=UPI00200808EB|nr:hypothetical protein Pst134EA_033144 [Puccinia striiformis f. sp. tritici]KAH9450095.1 hypothetical protein Pst134EA_033144 [Puccinia striiformis f. sp. tritici]